MIHLAKKLSSATASAFSHVFAETPPAFGMSVMINTIAKKYKSVPGLSTDVVYKWLQEIHQQGKSNKQHLLLCDIRPPHEYNISHIPGALQLDPDILDMKAVQQLLITHARKNEFPSDAEVKVVMYCSVGYRSSVMVNRYLESHKQKLIDEDTFKLFNLEGSIFKWGNEKRPLVDKDEQITQLVHPFSPMWGKMLFKDIRA
ncbi:uncharacterized protein LOC117122124 isoform X2 [Anneissia japonica]|uniref:uncharacterized protein LOC117122124 isoform X2 n=1 Tax=Anneissia japonica TaxID=1529436 RepID=UPI001425804B|nr:uncharacterized protein LOC117122124 isoform X2 [Anneissia japonica]